MEFATLSSSQAPPPRERQNPNVTLTPRSLQVVYPTTGTLQPSRTRNGADSRGIRSALLSRDPGGRPLSAAPCSPAPSACAEPWPGSGTQAAPVTPLSLLASSCTGPAFSRRSLACTASLNVAFRTGGHTHRCLPFAKTLSGPPSAAFHWPRIACPCLGPFESSPLFTPALRYTRSVWAAKERHGPGRRPEVHHLGPHLKQVPPLTVKPGPAS